MLLKSLKNFPNYTCFFKILAFTNKSFHQIVQSKPQSSPVSMDANILGKLEEFHGIVIQTYLDLLRCFIVLYRSCIFYKLKVCGNSVLSTSIGTIFPICSDDSIFSNKVFLIEVCTLFFRHNIIAHFIIDYRQDSVNITKKFVTHFSAIFALLHDLEQNLQYLQGMPVVS